MWRSWSANSTYDYIAPLPHPENDAVDMAAALVRLGFDVTTELDADRVSLRGRRCARSRGGARRRTSRWWFYGGHGIEMDGVNCMLPIDARLERDVDVRYETVTLDDLLVSMAGASLRLVLLDACRNNPLARSMQRTAATRTVAYTAAGNHGGGRPGAGTARTPAALLTHLETPLEIGLLFRRVAGAGARGDRRASSVPTSTTRW